MLGGKVVENNLFCEYEAKQVGEIGGKGTWQFDAVGDKFTMMLLVVVILSYQYVTLYFYKLKLYIVLQIKANIIPELQLEAETINEIRKQLIKTKPSLGMQNDMVEWKRKTLNVKKTETFHFF